MKNLSILFVIFISSISFAQKNKQEFQVPNIPVNSETNLITYEKTINIIGSQKEIYTKLLRWYTSYFKNPTEVIREKNEQEGRIIGKYRFKYNFPPDKKGIEAYAGILQYTITVETKEGSYSYIISDFNNKDISYTPVEYWLDKNSQKYTTSCDYFLIQLDSNIQEVIADLEHFMKTGNHKK